MALQPARKENIEWRENEECEVYCQLKQRWVKGEIVSVTKDRKGKWVKVEYGQKRIEVRPDSSEIRKIIHNSAEKVSEWKVGSQCEVYIRETGQWAEGEVINTFTDNAGYCIRVQYGQRIRDVLPVNVANELRARGTYNLAVTNKDFQKLKSATQERSVIGNVLRRILSNLVDCEMDGSGQSSVYLPIEKL